MKLIDHAVIAPLVRGLCIAVSGKSRVAVGTELPKAGMGERTCTVDLSSALSGGVMNEEAAAKLLSEACAAWVFERAPAGAEALRSSAVPTHPGCIAVTVEDETALYWVDADLDGARRRMAEGDDSLWTGTAAAPREGIAAAAPAQAAAADRASVVAGKVALVTGGAQGFGEEIVRGLAASGALVYIADLNLAGAEKLAAALTEAAGKTVALPLSSNVADEASVEAMFRTVAETTGGLDLCVSNAGVLKVGSVLEQDLGAFKFVTDVNYTGFFIVSKHCGRLLRRQSRTAPRWKTDIIQINSKSGLEGSNKNGAYAGGKFGGIGLVASFAMELVEYGIKVNAICPGNFFDGPLWSDPEKGLFVQYLNTGKVPGAKTIADVKAFYEAKVPMKRGCEGADVMRALYYIVEQEYETGQAVPVTGGQIMLH